MTDNRIRCVLIYRLSSKGSSLAASDSGVTILAKYDHASQYETHAGSAGDSGTLYGGKDKKYADAIGMVIGKDPPGQVSDSGTLGGFKVVQSDVHQVVYGADSDMICLAVITGLKYPSRVAIQMLTELYKQFSDKFGLQAKAATTNSLTKKCKSMLTNICKKYDDLSKVDKATALIGRVEEVKVTMQDNIASMLANTEKADSIAQQSEQLNEQASVFKKKSTDLRKTMRWKNMKMTIILVLIVVGILAIILIPLIVKAKKAAEAGKKF